MVNSAPKPPNRCGKKLRLSMGYRAGYQRNPGSIPHMGTYFFSPKHPAGLWGPPSLFCGGKAAELLKRPLTPTSAEGGSGVGRHRALFLNKLLQPQFRTFFKIKFSKSLKNFVT